MVLFLEGSGCTSDCIKCRLVPFQTRGNGSKSGLGHRKPTRLCDSKRKQMAPGKSLPKRLPQFFHLAFSIASEDSEKELTPFVLMLQPWLLACSEGAKMAL